MKALELLLFGFPEKVKLLDHFFQSYNKNYSFNIFGIPEVDEPSTSEYYDPRMQNGTMLTKAGQRRFNEEMKKHLLNQSEFGGNARKEDIQACVPLQKIQRRQLRVWRRCPNGREQ